MRYLQNYSHNKYMRNEHIKSNTFSSVAKKYIFCLNFVQQNHQHRMQGKQLNDLLQYLQKEKAFTSSGHENQIMDNLILQHRHSSTLPKESTIKLIQLIQSIGLRQLPSVKALQVLRVLTKPLQYRAHLKVDFFERINSLLGEGTSNVPLLVEILALDLRFVEIEAHLVSDEMFGDVLDLLVMNNSEITRVIIEITKQLTGKGINKVLEEVWYVGRLLFALERLEPSNKPKLVTLIKDLLECKHFNENFRRINGVPTLINELRKAHPNNLHLRLSLLNCLYRLLTTTKTEAIYDFKLNNFVGLISLKLQDPLNYKEQTLMIRILTHLMLDNDISGKYVEEGLIQEVIILLVRAHPTNSHILKFQDVEQQDEQEAFEEFKLLLLRMLRYISSLERNRKLFKQIFPLELLSPFMDVGHFIKPLKAYMETLKVFNKLDDGKVVGIEDEYQKLAKLFASKNYKLQVVGSYSLVEELGQGGFGSVFLAKKGANQYALKRIKIDNLEHNKDNIEELSRQVKIYRALKHPNIVKFYESFMQEGYLYIVMEVIKGSNLSELIKSQNEKSALLPEETIWRILICLLSVLRYLHLEKKIIHRDLNPSNIMVDNKLNIKVTDFGLAKSMKGGENLNQSFVGTVSYSAPEIVQRQKYNEKADIWSLGCILHELMSLKPAFSGNNPLLMAKIIVNSEFSSDLPEQYSTELREFVRVCFTMDEKKRPGVTQLMQKIVGRIMEYSDELKDKQTTLSEEIIQLSKKISGGGLGGTHTRLFGTSLYNSTSIQPPRQANPPLNATTKLPSQPLDDQLRQTQLVKLDSDVLNKIGEDPMSKFIEIIKKLSLIASTQMNLKKNFKKFVVDSFYNRVLISNQFNMNEVKAELNKLINLSKEQVVFLGVKFELKQNYIKSITYQMLYFYVEELYDLIKK